MSPVKKILSTGSLDEELVAQALAAGCILDIIPFISTQTIADKSLDKEIIALSITSQAVIFTSRHAVEAVIEKLKGIRPGWRIYCIDGTTSSLVKKYFGQDRIKGSATDAASLARVVAEKNKEQEVLFFCGDQRRDELPEILKKENIALREMVVYKTISLDNITGEEYDAVLFFSPSAVDAFFKNNRIADHTVLFAIGETTSGQIKKYSGNELIVGRQPDKNELTHTAIRYLNQKQTS